MSLLDDALRKLEEMKKGGAQWTPIPPEYKRKRRMKFIYFLPLLIIVFLLIVFIPKKKEKVEEPGFPSYQITKIDALSKKKEDVPVKTKKEDVPYSPPVKIKEQPQRKEEVVEIRKENDSKLLAKKLFQFGVSKEKAGAKREAALSYIEALKKDPDLFPARLNLAALYLEEGYLTEAERELHILLEKKPLDPKVNLNLAILHMKKNDRAEAEKYLLKTLEISPQNTRARLLLGSIYETEEREKEAIDLYEKGLLYDPDNSSLHYRLGRLYDLKGDVESALRHYRKYINLGGERREIVLSRISYLEKIWQSQ